MPSVTLKAVLVSTASAAGLLSAGSAFAQAAAPNVAPVSERFEVAQSGPAVGEVVVTARRRAETVQTVPIAVSVVSGDQINATGANTVGKLQQLAPSVQFFTSNPRNSAVTVRGFGAPFGLTNDGIEQGVGVYVDDVYSSRAASSTFDFLDVARVEILRGPQGTLYGKNTTAGAVNITTNQPTFAFEGFGEVSVGNLNLKQAKAAVSGPLTDTVAFRLALSSTDRRGTLFNVKSQNYVNEQDNLGIRAQLLFKPNDKLDVTLAGDWSEQNPEGQTPLYVRTGATQRPIARQYAALAAAQGYVVASTDPFARIADIDSSLNAGNTIGGASARLRWNLGPGALTAVSAWRFWDWRPENDRDYTGLSIVAKSQNPSQQDQYTQELRYNLSTDRFDWVVGAFGFHQKIDTQGVEAQGVNASRWNINPTNVLSNDPSVLNGLTALNEQHLSTTSIAGYSQLAWNVTDAFTLQPGVRLNYDKKKGFYQRRVYTAAGTELLFSTPGAVATEQRAIYAPQLVTPEYSDWNFSYDLTARYRFTPTINTYLTYAKTFKSGGINQNGVPADAAGNPIIAAGTVKPESVNHYEAGIKTQFWDRKAILNLAVYNTDVTNYQANVNNGQFGVLRGYLANAGKARARGAEVDFSVRPSARFNAYVNGAYTDATYVRFVDAPCPPELSGGTVVTGTQVPGAAGVPGSLSPANCDISGQRLPGVSKWSFSAGFEVNTPVTLLAQDGQVYFGAEGTYRSNFSSNPSPSAYTWIDGYGLANVRVGLRTDAGLDLALWVRNAFDKDYFSYLVVGPGNTGLIAGEPGDPRTYGVTLRSRF